MDIHIILEKGESGYWVYSPELPGCTSWGESIESARANMKEAVSGHIAVAREFGEESIVQPLVEVMRV